MKRPQPISIPRANYWLAPLCLLVLAFQLTTHQQVTAIQQANEQQHNSATQEHNVAQTGPMMSLGSESSAALEASAALAGDDLIAAESSQSPDAAEHKAFTSAQVLRQDPQQQMAASVAPVFAAPQQQQVQPQQSQAQQQMQQQFNMHPQHMQAIRMPPHQQQQAGAHPQQKPFNPFMAAALAGNYGPAQQQIAAAAAASLHAQQQQHPQHPQQQVLPHQQHPQHVHQMVAPHQHQQHQHVHQQMVSAQAVAAAHQQQHPRQQQQMAAAAVAAPQVAAAPQEPAGALAVQESSVRQNIVPAPNSFNSMLDSNSIELNDAPAQAHQQQQASNGQQTQMAVASSAQHPVIASVASSTAMQESQANAWPLQAPDIPKIVNLEVKCEKNLMKVSIEFDKVFNGVIFSKGHYNQGQCVHVGQNSGKQQAYFDISINSCGTQGNTQNGLYGMGGNTGSGTYFENTIVVQYDPNVQEVYDHARKLRCTWHDQYEKAVTFRPFPVDMLDIVRADFAGDNVGCWMQIQVGKGPWASEVAGIVKIGQTMTMVLAIKDEENKFDMLVRNCFAHDGKRGPIELVDKSGCITRPKLMSRFTKIKNFGSSATVLSYAHFQAFKFPDSMEVHFQCTIQICRHQCPEQCSAGPNTIGGSNGESYSESTISGTFNINGASSGGSSVGAAASDSVHLRKYGSSGSALSRERRDLQHSQHHHHQHWNGSHPMNGGRHFQIKPMTQTVGLNRIIQVVSTGDLAFAIQQQAQQVNGTTTLGDSSPLISGDSTARVDLSQQICMSSYNFVLSLVVLVLILLCSCLIAISLYMRQRSYAKRSNKLLVPSQSSASSTCSSSPTSTMRSQSQQHVPSQHHHHQQQQQIFNQNRHHNLHHHHQTLMFDASKLHQ